MRNIKSGGWAKIRIPLEARWRNRQEYWPEKKQNAETKRDRALAQNRSLTIEKEKAVWQLQKQKADEQRHISLAVSQTTAEKDKTIRMLKGALKASKDLLNVFADILYKASEVFETAIDAIISFGTEQHKSVFSPSEAADIKSVMLKYGGNHRAAESGWHMAL